jgi:uncharacterized delta-60 repeat protein
MNAFRSLAPNRCRARKSRSSGRRAVFRPAVEALETRTLLSAGMIDPSFGTGGGATTHFAGTHTDLPVAVLVQPLDSKILVGGYASNPNFAYSVVLARFNPDGTLDATFGSGGQVSPIASALFVGMVLQPDGKIVVVGSPVPPAGFFLLARLNADGSPDSSFGQDGLVRTDGGGVNGVVLQGDKIVVVGAGELTRYNPDGSLDSSFGTGGKKSIPVAGGVADVAIQSDGKLVFPAGPSGIVSTPNSVWSVFRLNPDGTTDTGFGPDGSAAVDFGIGTHGAVAFGVRIAGDGRIVTAGTSDLRQALVRINGDGSLDPTFGINGKGGPAIDGSDLSFATGTIALQPDNAILVAGPASATLPQLVLARYLPDGSLDMRFGAAGQASGPLLLSPSHGIAVQADGKIVVIGAVAGAGGGTDFAVVRYSGGPDDLPEGTPNERFVNQAYLDLLGRTADAAGLAHWTGLLDQGSVTRTEVALGIEQSAEFQARVVSRFYGQYLQRGVDPVGEAGWTHFLATGGTMDELRALILSSDEYAALHPPTGQSVPFVQGLYHDLLYRTPDAVGAGDWTQALDNGASHLAVATAILGSVEGRTDEVQGLYHALLHRAPDPAGQEALVNALRGGTSSEDVIALLVGSEEYFQALGPSGA